MYTPAIQYRLYIDKNINNRYPSVIVLTEHTLKYHSNLLRMLDYFSNLELIATGILTPLLLLTNSRIMNRLTVIIISSGIIDFFYNVVHRFSGVIYVVDTQRNVIYNINNLLRQIPHITNSTSSCSNDRAGFCNLSIEIARYVWYRLFFSILLNFNHTDVSERELLAYINWQPTQHKQESNPGIMDIVSDPVNLYTMICPIYPNVKSVLPIDDVKRIFALRYAIICLTGKMKDLNNEKNKKQIERISVYRGATSSIAQIEEMKSAVGSIITKISFVCGCLNENRAKLFATGDMQNPYKQPIMQKVNVSTNNKATYGYLSDKNEITGEDLIILPCLSLFRINKIERTEHFWYLEATFIDEQDEEYRLLTRPWDQLINEQYQFQSRIGEEYFRYLSVDNASFLRFQVLVDVLLRMEPNNFAKPDLIEFCRSKYNNNTEILHQIDLFEQTYQSEDAILWYTRDCFLSRILNEVLRKERDDNIMKLRYFIYDLHNQLAKLQINYLQSLPNNQPNMVVYRGQTMPMEELEHLRQHQCSLISMNNFVSTTGNYDVAIVFSGGGISQIEKGHVSVIFEISIDTRPPLTVPFARIDNQSIYRDEEEILFSMAAVFRIQNVEKIDDRFWHIKLILDRNIYDEQLLLLTNHLKD